MLGHDRTGQGWLNMSCHGSAKPWYLHDKPKCMCASLSSASNIIMQKHCGLWGCLSPENSLLSAFFF